MERRLPSKEEIEELAKALYYLEHPEAAAIGVTPERHELSEGNYLVKARNLLMRGEEGPILAEYERMKHMWLEGIREELEGLGYTIVPKKRWEELTSSDLVKLTEELEIAKAQIESLKKKLKKGEISKKEFEREKAEEIEELKSKIRELTELLRRERVVKVRILKPFTWGIMKLTPGEVIEVDRADAEAWIREGKAERVAPEVPVHVPKPPPPPTPPPKPPVKIPKPKVLPPIPEKCPVCGAPLEKVDRIPLLIEDPLKLSPEEEYWRARMGLPLPTKHVEWIDVPATMKVWMCSGAVPHYFERDVRGRLVQRTPEYLYRKIIRETAKLRKVAAPPPPTPLPYEVEERYRAWMRRYVPPPKEMKAIQLHPRDWLLRKGISFSDFLRLPESERKRLMDEYLREVREGL